MIIAIEGIDGASKATQTKILAECLKEKGYNAASISFPNYETETGKIIAKMLQGRRRLAAFDDVVYSDVLLKEEAYAFQALMTINRYEDYTVLSAAEDDNILVLDRYWLSALAYGLVDELDEDWLLRIHRPLPKAYHIVIDISPEEALKRRPEARDKFEKDIEKQKKVRDVYNRLVKTPPSCLENRVFSVDGNGSVEDVAGRIWGVVKGFAGFSDAIQLKLL